ncbi:Hsp70 family protein [Neobacillus novalis]|uniref:Chaperone protein DnaK n=1 Tax=Neobacillus novalis TaxID=220687 RepID=A0AA95SHU7_9BACI|nr:Hsp70 family protein [Neobacillus novalis]WHY87296.1 Hsp70 family protein [Neobacillus novalis]
MTLIGIDLGTTNSAMAYLKNGKPEIIINDRGERTTPSFFQVDRENKIQIGAVAKNAYTSYPWETVLEVKRLMGTEQKVDVSGNQYRPEEISSYYLRYLKDSAEKFLGKPVTEAVITVPAYFSDAQRKATKIAGEIAGLKVERIVNEPTAAAIAFGFENMDKDQHILVYDLGGGTFDVSVVELFSGVVEVKASAGNNHLGGMDFDNAIVDWFVKKYKTEQGIDLFGFGTEQELLQRKARLKVEAENVKKALSTQSSARLNLPFFAIYHNSPISIDEEITRTQFEKLINSLAESTLEQIDKVLKDAKLTTHDITEILLVGGSIRIPLIQRLVEMKFGKTPRKDINPDEAVALGAAVQAGIKSGEIDSSKGLMVLDVCPYTLGVDVVKNVGGRMVSGFFDPIIPRNSTIPVTESNTYVTIADNQDEMYLGVYQGDDEDQYVRSELRIGENDIIISGIPRRQAGQEKIEVKFTYDINGLLEVEATILSTGKKQTEVIDVQKGVMSKPEISLAKEKLQREWNQSEFYHEVKNVINRAEKIIDEVSPNEQAKIHDMLSNLKNALSQNNANLVKKYEEELTDLLIELV